MSTSKKVTICDICSAEMDWAQGYGLKGGKSKLQYTKDHSRTEKHICHGCMISLYWIFDDSTGTRSFPEMRL